MGVPPTKQYRAVETFCALKVRATSSTLPNLLDSRYQIADSREREQYKTSADRCKFQVYQECSNNETIL
jgi:hypothetical protein